MLHPKLPEDGIAIFVKSECETCLMIKPLIKDMINLLPNIIVISQDDPTFSKNFSIIDDRELELSYRCKIETVPTVIYFKKGAEIKRSFGWHRQEWQDLSGLENLGTDLPNQRPGCGSRTQEPGALKVLEAKYSQTIIQSREISFGEWDDEMEVCFERGWSDGLPVTPPTDARILRMLQGTNRKPDEIIGMVPPNLVPISVEKVAINAVLAGCLPEYMPVILTALEASLEPEATMHGVLCTTCFSSPILVVNGPISEQIGMNSGINCLGQGNRANATIGRALQLIIRNVGGGIPGELDRAVLGGPGKFTFCFAEDESDPTWMPLNQSRGFKMGTNTVTLFQGDGIQGFIDQRSRTPEELVQSLARSLMAVGNWKLCEFTNAMLVLVPEHYAIFREMGWNRKKITTELHNALRRPGKDVIKGAHGIGEGVDPDRIDEMVNKFWPEGLQIVHAGGQAGLFSAICAGWTGGRFRNESKTVTKEIKL